MPGALAGDKRCCGFPRKRVAYCGVITVLIAVAAIVTVVLLTRPPDDIETVEKNDSDNVMAADELTVIKTGVFSTDPSAVNGSLSLVQVMEDSSFLLAVNDFRIAATDCEELNVRLLAATSTSSADGLLVVPLTSVDATTTVDFTEPLGSDFDPDLYAQAALWCTTSGGIEKQLGTPVELVTPSTLEEGGTLVIRQARLSGSGSYTVEGLVQIVGFDSIVDGALVTSYSLRFQDIEVSSGPDVFLYLTTDADDPNDVDAEGSLTVLLEGAERGTFSFTGNFSQVVPDGFVSPDEYVAAVVWCDQFSVFFGSGLFEDVF